MPRTKTKRIHLTDLWVSTRADEYGTEKGRQLRDSKDHEWGTLGLIARNNRKHSWFAQVTAPGMGTKIRVLGQWPAMKRDAAIAEGARVSANLHAAAERTQGLTTESSFRAVAEICMAERAAKKKWKATTVRLYTRGLEMYVYPHIGNVRIGDLGFEHAEKVFKKLKKAKTKKTAKPISGQYRNIVNVSMRHVFNYARARKLCDHGIDSWRDEFAFEEPKVERKPTNIMPDVWSRFVETIWDVVPAPIAACLVGKMLTAQRRITISQMMRDDAVVDADGNYTAIKIWKSREKGRFDGNDEVTRLLPVSPQFNRLLKLCDELWPHTKYFFPALSVLGRKPLFDYPESSTQRAHVWDLSIAFRHVIEAVNALYDLELRGTPHAFRQLFHTIAERPVTPRSLSVLEAALGDTNTTVASAHQYTEFPGLGFAHHIGVSWVQGRAMNAPETSDPMGEQVYNKAKPIRLFEAMEPVIHAWGAYVEKYVGADILVPSPENVNMEAPSRRTSGWLPAYVEQKKETAA